jgi:hypothetical protein
MDEVPQTRPGPLHTFSLARAPACGEMLGLHLVSACCDAYTELPAAAIVAPGPLYPGGAAPADWILPQARSVAFNVTLHEDRHCYAAPLSYNFALLWQEPGEETVQDIVMKNVSCVFHDYVGQVAPLELAGLRPARDYLVKVRGQPVGSHHPAVWSPWLQLTVTTLPGVPEPPVSSALAFTALRRDHGAALVTFHWSPQPEGDTNGPGFRYLGESGVSEHRLYLPGRVQVPAARAARRPCEHHAAVPRGDGA